jgi:hypothetical protein
VPYAAWALQADEANARVGRAVADLITEGETVVLKRGTTTTEVAFGHVCAIDALERLATNAGPEQTAALDALGPLVDRV